MGINIIDNGGSIREHLAFEYVFGVPTPSYQELFMPPKRLALGRDTASP
jgi:hypothetical protein